MATYGIEQAMLSADTRLRDEPEGRNHWVYYPWADEGVALLGGIAAALRCIPIQILTPRSEPKIVRILGFPSDLDRVEVLNTSLHTQMHRALQNATVPEGVNGRAWRRSWLIGFAQEVSKRIKDAETLARQRAATTSTGWDSETVLTDRQARVLQLSAREFPNLAQPRIKTFTGTGMADGRAAGALADVAGPQITGRLSSIEQ